MLKTKKGVEVLSKPQPSSIKLSDSILPDRKLMLIIIGMITVAIVTGMVISSGYIAQINWATPKGNSFEFQLKPSAR
jgi:hypothetical protein